MISLYIVCLVVVIIGALNWGVIGAANLNLVQSVTSLMSSDASTVTMVNRGVYVLVGLAGLVVLWKSWGDIVHHHHSA